MSTADWLRFVGAHWTGEEQAALRRLSAHLPRFYLLT